MIVDRPRPIDWRELISRLRSHGYSLRQIGAALLVTHSTVQSWERGSIPNHADGEALLTLARMAGCTEFRTNAPQETATTRPCDAIAPNQET